MGKKRSPEEIVKEAYPDLEIDESRAPASTGADRPATRPGPSIAELRRKYLGDAAADAAGGADAYEAKAAVGGKVKVTRVRAKKSPADPADDPGPRTVVLDEDEGVIGSQG